MRRRTMMRRGIAVLIAAVLMPLMAGCGQVQVTTALSGAPEGPTIAIGVAADEPWLGYWHDGDYEGLDIDIAKYVATKLGYANKQIIFKQVRPENRASQLEEGNVDMVVASWLITDQSKQAVNFAGPYLKTGIGVLVRERDATTLAADDNPSLIGSLAGRTACAAKGDEAAELLSREQPEVTIQERDSYAQCVTAMQVGAADAIVADEAILAGLQAADNGRYSTLLRVNDRRDYGYGIAVRRDAPQLASSVANALNDMIEDGSWAAVVHTYESATGSSVGYASEAEAIVNTE